MLIVIFELKVSHHSPVFPISSVLLFWSPTSSTLHDPPPPLLSQEYMFNEATAFNQDIGGGWDVSRGIYFGSGFSLLQDFYGLFLDLGALSLFLLSFERWCFVCVVFFIIYMLIILFHLKVSHHSSSVCPISSLLLLWSPTSILHDSPCFHRITCVKKQCLSIKTLVVGMLLAVESSL